MYSQNAQVERLLFHILYVYLSITSIPYSWTGVTICRSQSTWLLLHNFTNIIFVQTCIDGWSDEYKIVVFMYWTDGSKLISMCCFSRGPKFSWVASIHQVAHNFLWLWIWGVWHLLLDAILVTWVQLGLTQTHMDINKNNKNKSFKAVIIYWEHMTCVPLNISNSEKSC